MVSLPEKPGAPAQVPVRILVVDDHEMFATSLAQALQSEPDLLVVGQATSIAQARELVASAAPDVVVGDEDGDLAAGWGRHGSTVAHGAARVVTRAHLRTGTDAPRTTRRAPPSGRPVRARLAG